MASDIGVWAPGCQGQNLQISVFLIGPWLFKMMPASRVGVPASQDPGEAHSSFWLGRGRGGGERRMAAFLPPLHVAQPQQTQPQSAAV